MRDRQALETTEIAQWPLLPLCAIIRYAQMYGEWYASGFGLQEVGPSVLTYFNFCSEESVTYPNLIADLAHYMDLQSFRAINRFKENL